MSSLHATSQILRNLTGREQVLLSGRAAAGIWATLKAFGYANRKILLPANTCYIVLWAVLHSGNTPVLTDVDPQTANITPQLLKHANVTDAAAIIPCHMYGLPAPMAAICAWANKRGITVIEDAALALGTEAAGVWGDVSVFSFGLGKIVDHQVGGALATNDARLAQEIARILADAPVWDDTLLNLTNQWHHLYWALHQYEDKNPRLLTLYPALFEIYRPLVVYQLPPEEWRDLPNALNRLDKNLAQRAHMAALYDERLVDLPLRRLERPTGSILWRYPLLVSPVHRDDLLAYLWENGIHDATRWYPSLRYMASALIPDTPQPPTPTAALLGASIINLRVDVDTDYVENVAAVITQFFKNE